MGAPTDPAFTAPASRLGVGHREHQGRSFGREVTNPESFRHARCFETAARALSL